MPTFPFMNFPTKRTVISQFFLVVVLCKLFDVLCVFSRCLAFILNSILLKIYFLHEDYIFYISIEWSLCFILRRNFLIDFILIEELSDFFCWIRAIWLNLVFLSKLFLFDSAKPNMWLRGNITEKEPLWSLVFTSDHRGSFSVIILSWLQILDLSNKPAAGALTDASNSEMLAFSVVSLAHKYSMSRNHLCDWAMLTELWFAPAKISFPRSQRISVNKYIMA